MILDCRQVAFEWAELVLKEQGRSRLAAPLWFEPVLMD
jgi:hypothetical protein